MAICVIGEQKLSHFQFNVDKEILTATLSSLVCESSDGCDEYAYSVVVTDRDGNPVMKEVSSDFQDSCDVFDRLTLVLGDAVKKNK